MIDPKLFTVEKLLAALLNVQDGHHNRWWALAEIDPNYHPPFAQPGDRPKCVVKCKNHFLRHSCGPLQGHFWDMYGDDYQRPELALMALMQAPIPPHFIDREIWREAGAAMYNT